MITIIVLDNTYVKPIRHRKSPRLQGYDYSQSGAYFVTICTQQRQHLFGEVDNGTMYLNCAGEIAREHLIRIPAYWSQQVDLDIFVVMPNHIHAILVLVGTPFLASMPEISPHLGGQKTDTQKRVPTLGRVIGNYKAGVTRRINQQDIHQHHNRQIWQSRYHDHIMRSESDMDRIRQYVLHNPQLWSEDVFYSTDAKLDEGKAHEDDSNA